MLAELPRSLCAPSVFLTFPDPFPEANTETLPFCHRVLRGEISDSWIPTRWVLKGFRGGTQMS